MALFVVKINETRYEQIENLYVEAGPAGSAWYGDVQIGDFVLPMCRGKVNALWRLREYGPVTLTNGDTSEAAWFDKVENAAFHRELTLRDDITHYRWFEVSLTLLNKIIKSTRGVGFHRIPLEPGAPSPEQMSFSTDELRRFYLVKEGKPLPFLRDADIVVVVGNTEGYPVRDIQVARMTPADTSVVQENPLSDNCSVDLIPYHPLKALYESRNAMDERYSMAELLQYAEADNAPKKASWLKSVIRALDDQGLYEETHPLRLYDNFLVGRKWGGSNPSGEESTPNNNGIPIPDRDPSEEDDDALEDDLLEYKQLAELLDFLPNLILYGPPGTGKTYATSKIIEAMDHQKLGERRTLKQIRNEKRVDFITFHQSYSYEDFVEGIRPEMAETEQDRDVLAKNDSDGIRYRIEDGILKRIANRAALDADIARSSVVAEESNQQSIARIRESARVWKVSLGNKQKDGLFYEQCIRNNEIGIGFVRNSIADMDGSQVLRLVEEQYAQPGSDETSTPQGATYLLMRFSQELQENDVVLVFNSQKSIRAIGLVSGEYRHVVDSFSQYPHRRTVEWIYICKENEPIDISQIPGFRVLSLATLYQVTNWLTPGHVVSLLEARFRKDKGQEALRKLDKVPQKSGRPHYLVIDEINRGNISKIFGELMTLLEKDKRGSFTVKLPYSRSDFSLPRNLYVIGTMNTADRSIAVLDTALRRRFVFKELEPDIDIFERVELGISPMVGTVHLGKLLTVLNTRITSHLDRDHRIGHAYLLDINTIEDLAMAWYYRVLPLLMEYFYDDPDALQAIIGKSFIKQGALCFLEAKSARGEISRFEQAILDMMEMVDRA